MTSPAPRAPFPKEASSILADEPLPDAPPHHAELAHFVTAAIAAMSLVPLGACLFGLGSEPGTEAWQNWLLGLLIVAALYLLALAFSHLGEAWRGADGAPAARWTYALRILLDLAVAAVAVAVVLRGPTSRLLLAGFGDALPGLMASAGVSAAIWIYSRWREPPTDPPAERRPVRGVFYTVIGLTLLAGLITCELQPLPRITPPVEMAGE